MYYSQPSEATLLKFQKIVGIENVLIDNNDLEKYAKDETEDLIFYPSIAIIPSNSEQISSILKICNEENIPVTPRGAGTGLSGGALPVHKGVVISTEKFNKILLIDERNLQITVEPGVITQVLQEAVQEKGLFYPPDPSSRGSCFIGGNVLENAGGPKAVKYGVTSDYVLNLEMVLPNGQIIWTGANVLKNSTGYNLTQLMIGSEGTLGIVTKIVLKLIPYPDKKKLMLVPFSSAEKACQAVSAIFTAGITPSGLEFMERDAIDWTLKYVGDINIDIKDSVMAHLLVEVDGNNESILFEDCEKIAEIMQSYESDEILFAESEREQENLWRLRRRVAEAVKSNSIYKEEDTVVPRAELPELLKGVKRIGKKYNFKSVCYGHAGDGNLHVNIIKDNMTDKEWNQELPKGIREIFELCVELGGTISGEHGIGYVQKNYMDIAFESQTIELQKNIKAVFDPNQIMNPGKIFN